MAEQLQRLNISKEFPKVLITAKPLTLSKKKPKDRSAEEVEEIKRHEFKQKGLTVRTKSAKEILKDFHKDQERNHSTKINSKHQPVNKHQPIEKHPATATSINQDQQTETTNNQQQSKTTSEDKKQTTSPTNNNVVQEQTTSLTSNNGDQEQTTSPTRSNVDQEQATAKTTHSKDQDQNTTSTIYSEEQDQTTTSTIDSKDQGQTAKSTSITSKRSKRTQQQHDVSTKLSKKRRSEIIASFDSVGDEEERKKREEFSSKKILALLENLRDEQEEWAKLLQKHEDLQNHEQMASASVEEGKEFLSDEQQEFLAGKIDSETFLDRLQNTVEESTSNLEYIDQEVEKIKRFKNQAGEYLKLKFEDLARKQFDAEPNIDSPRTLIRRICKVNSEETSDTKDESSC